MDSYTTIEIPCPDGGDPQCKKFVTIEVSNHATEDEIEDAKKNANCCSYCGSDQ